MSAFQIAASIGDVVLSTYMAEPPSRAPLNPEEWARVREHLDAALALAPERRADYLDRACAGDARLRGELESLIAASEGPAMLDAPAMPTVTLGTGSASGQVTGLQPRQAVGHYEVIAKIGEGGMGAVYRAIDRNLGRTVALKVISSDFAGQEERQRLAREAKAASALNSPNIITIYEFDSDHGRDFIVMEYVKGSTLRTLIHERRLPLGTLLDYARQAAGAVATAHAAGIVHRDLKPGNIMVTDQGVVKVLDFGLCKQQETGTAGSEDTLTQGLTRTGMVLGTPCYMSPEQAMGEPAGRLSDIFAFGVILYEIACGRRPFEGKNSQATLYQIAHKNPPAPAEVNPATPRRLAELIERCLQKEAGARPQSMDEVAAALADLTTAPTRPSRRGLLASLGVLGTAALAAAVWMAERHVPPNAGPRALTYSIEAQKPTGEPYLASPADTFEAGWRFRLHARSAQAGYLYLINRGADETGGQRFWILYPVKNTGTALAPGREALTGWYRFDQNAGTERLWLVWSEEPVDPIETAVRGSEAGKVTSVAAASSLEQLLAGLKKGRATPTSEGEWRLEWDTRPGLPGELLELKHK